MRRLRILLGVPLGLSLAAGCGRQVDEPASHRAVASQGATVALQIDFGEGRRKAFAAVPIRSHATVKDVMEVAQAMPPGFTFTVEGQGAHVLLTSIDGVVNQGTGDKSRNWLFWINDVMASQGFAAQPAVAGDHIEWRFAASPF